MDGRATPLVLLDDTACSVCVETQKIRYLPSSIPIVPITLRRVACNGDDALTLVRIRLIGVEFAIIRITIFSLAFHGV